MLSVFQLLWLKYKPKGRHFPCEMPPFSDGYYLSRFCFGRFISLKKNSASSSSSSSPAGKSRKKSPVNIPPMMSNLKKRLSSDLMICNMRDFLLFRFRLIGLFLFQSKRFSDNSGSYHKKRITLRISASAEYDRICHIPAQLQK